MAYTLLDVVNRCLRRQRLINSSSEYLTDFSQTRLRVDVDMMVDAINDTFRYLYDVSELSPYGSSQATITLVEDQREYDTPTTFYKMTSETLVNHDDGHRLCEYPGGFIGMFEEQNIPSSYDGQPNYWAITPEGRIRLDTSPPQSHAGHVYTYVHQTQINYELHDTVIPIPEMVIRDLTPAIIQMYRRESNPDKYDEGAFINSIAMSVSSLHNRAVDSHYA